MFARPGQTIYPELDGAPTGAVGTLGISVERKSDGAVVIARVTTGIRESPAGSGHYIATLVAPATNGSYSMEWDTGSRYASEELEVVGTIPTGLTVDAILTIAEARTYLGPEAQDTPSDGWLELVIAGISDEIEKHTGRSYLPASSGPVTRVFDHDGDLSVPIDDAQGVTLVRLTGTPADSGSWIALTANDWVAEPLDETRKTRIRFLAAPGVLPAENRGWVFGGSQSSGWSPWPRQAAYEAHRYMAVEVTATWGGVPANVQLAAAMWVDALYRRDQAFHGRDFPDRNPQVGGMPGDVRAILDGESKMSGSAVMAV